MSRSSLGVAIVPVSAEDIGRRSYEQRYLIEDKIVYSLVEVINQGIHEQVSHGLLEYEMCVPAFIYGFPRFNVDYVARKLRELYADRGFVVKGGGRWVRLVWAQAQDPRTPALGSSRMQVQTTVLSRPPRPPPAPPTPPPSTGGPRSRKRFLPLAPAL